MKSSNLSVKNMLSLSLFTKSRTPDEEGGASNRLYRSVWSLSKKVGICPDDETCLNMLSNQKSKSNVRENSIRRVEISFSGDLKVDTERFLAALITDSGSGQDCVVVMTGSSLDEWPVICEGTALNVLNSCLSIHTGPLTKLMKNNRPKVGQASIIKIKKNSLINIAKVVVIPTNMNEDTHAIVERRFDYASLKLNKDRSAGRPIYVFVPKISKEEADSRGGVINMMAIFDKIAHELDNSKGNVTLVLETDTSAQPITNTAGRSVDNNLNSSVVSVVSSVIEERPSLSGWNYLADKTQSCMALNVKVKSVDQELKATDRIMHPLGVHAESVVSVVIEKRSSLSSWNDPADKSKSCMALNVEVKSVDKGWKETAILNHSRSVQEADINDNGRYIAVACDDRTVRIWEYTTTTGQWIKETTIKHDDWVNTVNFSFNGKYLVTASDDKTAKICEYVDNQWQETEVIRHADIVNKACFSSTGNKIMTASEDGTAQIWRRDNDGWKEDFTLEHRSNSINDISLSPKGKHILTASEEAAHVWKEISNGQWKEIGRIPHLECVNSVDFNYDGSYIVTASADHTAKIWGIIDKLWTEEVVIKHSNHVNCAIFSPTTNYMVTASDDKTAQVWKHANGAWKITNTITHDSWITSVRFSSNGQYFVTASGDSSAKICEMVDNKWQEKLTISHLDNVNTARFSSNGRYMVTGSDDKTAKICTLTDK
ncbi:MAG: hypothetical protein KAG53_10015 [Endozoicomonadaceae bacterium]|nr:hypothetical protein [Endozoicomonadaceae bacterium]